MITRIKKAANAALCLGIAALAATPAQAAFTLTLTGAGISDGFTLDPFIDTGASAQYTAFTVANTTGGQVLVSDNGSTNIYTFNNVNNQTLSNAVSTQTAVGNPGLVLTTLGGTIYGAKDGGSGNYYVLNADGTINSQLVLSPATALSNWGFWANPVTGHLLSSAVLSGTTASIIDINPLNGTWTTVETGNPVDGITVSPDGTRVYGAVYGGANANHILGWDISSLNNVVFDSGPIPVSFGSVDGSAVISGTCSVAGSIVLNNNDGTVGLLNPSNNNYSVIASGGSRGDFVSPDKSNGSLFLTQSNGLMRLTPAAGCSIGSVAAVPEPDDLPLFALGFATLAGIRLFKRR